MTDADQNTITAAWQAIFREGPALRVGFGGTADEIVYIGASTTGLSLRRAEATRRSIVREWKVPGWDVVLEVTEDNEKVDGATHETTASAILRAVEIEAHVRAKAALGALYAEELRVLDTLGRACDGLEGAAALPDPRDHVSIDGWIEAAAVSLYDGADDDVRTRIDTALRAIVSHAKSGDVAGTAGLLDCILSEEI